MSKDSLNNNALDLIFRSARTYSKWQNKAVDEDILRSVYDLMKFGATSANCCPLRIVFIKTAEEKERLKPMLPEGNIEQTMSAPVTAILGHDIEFYDYFDFLYPHADAKSWFIGNDDLVNETAFRNSSLQGAYFMIAARALGLDCGPMSGFDGNKINESFFPEGDVKVNFLCNLGYGNPESLHERNPRFEFDQVCKIL